MLKPIFISFLTAMLVVFAATASTVTASSADKQPLRIAYIDPLSGSMAAIGEQALKQF